MYYFKTEFELVAEMTTHNIWLTNPRAMGPGSHSLVCGFARSDFISCCARLITNFASEYTEDPFRMCLPRQSIVASKSGGTMQPSANEPLNSSKVTDCGTGDTFGCLTQFLDSTKRGGTHTAGDTALLSTCSSLPPHRATAWPPTACLGETPVRSGERRDETSEPVGDTGIFSDPAFDVVSDMIEAATLF